MDETELTRKAIEEIMREMSAQNEADKLPQIQERKKNPLGKPNKDFLDRTLNSVMTHNRRQLERNQRKCQRKLRDMDESRGDDHSKRQSRNISRNHHKTQRKRKYSQSSSSSSLGSSSSASKDRNTKQKKVKKKQKKDRKKERSMSSSSNSSSLSSSLGSRSSSSSSNSNSKSVRKRRKPKEEDFAEEFYAPYGEITDASSLGYYVDPNVALAAMALSHMNQMMQQQQQTMHDSVKDELEDEEVDDSKGEIFSDLSLTYNSESESELNVSVNSSSAEEDENGVLTFNLSSDEEIAKKKSAKPLATSVEFKRKPVKIKRKSRKSIQIADNDTDDSDTQSHISIESNKSPKKRHQTIEKVTILSSSSEGEGTLPKQDDVITTISSSSASSECEDEKPQRYREEITILSSCSSSCDTEDEIAENIEIAGSLGNKKDPTHISPTGKLKDIIELNENNEERNINNDLQNSSLGNLPNENEQEYTNSNLNIDSSATDLLNEVSEKKQMETNALESIALKQNELKAIETSTQKMEEKINLSDENEKKKQTNSTIANLTLDTGTADSMALDQYEATNVETSPSNKQVDSGKNDKETASNNSSSNDLILLLKDKNEKSTTYNLSTKPIGLNEEHPNQAEMPNCCTENVTLYKEAEDSLTFNVNELANLKTLQTQKEIVNQEEGENADANNAVKIESLTVETEDNRSSIPKEVTSFCSPKQKDMNVKDCSHATSNEVINVENDPSVSEEEKKNMESIQLAGKLLEDMETEDSISLIQNEPRDVKVPHSRKQGEIITSSYEVGTEKETNHSLNNDVEDIEKTEQDKLALITPASVLNSYSSTDSINEDISKNTENSSNVKDNINDDTNEKLEAKNKEYIKEEKGDVRPEETLKEPANDILIDLTYD